MISEVVNVDNFAKVVHLKDKTLKTKGHERNRDKRSRQANRS